MCLWINDYDGRVKINGKHIKSYKVWRSILQRCFNKKVHIIRPTYSNVRVCDEWLKFSNFKEWFDKNYPYDLEKKGFRLELDKDLLSGDEKIYSPETCVFLPHTVNNFLANKTSRNTSGYSGVSWHKSIAKWEVRINKFNSNKTVALGCYDNINDARDRYLQARKEELCTIKDYLHSLGYSERVINAIDTVTNI